MYVPPGSSASRTTLNRLLTQISVHNLSQQPVTPPAVRQLPVRCSCARKKAQRGSRAMRWPGKSEGAPTHKSLGGSNSRRQEQKQHQQRPVSPTWDNLTYLRSSRSNGLKEARRLFLPRVKATGSIWSNEAGRKLTPSTETPIASPQGWNHRLEAIRQSTNLESRVEQFPARALFLCHSAEPTISSFPSAVRLNRPLS